MIDKEPGWRRKCAVCDSFQRDIRFRLRLETRTGGTEDSYICDDDAPKVLAAIWALREEYQIETKTDISEEDT